MTEQGYWKNNEMTIFTDNQQLSNVFFKKK